MRHRTGRGSQGQSQLAEGGGSADGNGNGINQLLHQAHCSVQFLNQGKGSLGENEEGRDGGVAKEGLEGDKEEGIKGEERERGTVKSSRGFFEAGWTGERAASG